MARLDPTGQRWATSLANYNLSLHYKLGKLNVEADGIKMEQKPVQAIVNGMSLKLEASIEAYSCNAKLVKEIEPNTVSVNMTQEQWHMEQQRS